MDRSRSFFAIFIALACCGFGIYETTVSADSLYTANSRVETLVAPTPTPSPSPTPKKILEEEGVIRIDTELVNINVRVIDRNSRPIGGIRQNEFTVTEDGVPQKIELFMNEEIPLSYALAIDSSGTMRSQFGAIVQAAKNIVNANKETDETFLVRFISSDKIETVQEFTTNKRILLNGLDGLYIEGGATAVLDAGDDSAIVPGWSEAL